MVCVSVHTDFTGICDIIYKYYCHTNVDELCKHSACKNVKYTIKNIHLYDEL